METEFVNKVALSGIITLNLEDFLPKNEIIGLDIKQFLFMEMILKEKDFRAALPIFDWQSFENKHVAIYCSADAIVPTWAYMLITTYLKPFAATISFSNTDNLLDILFIQNFNNHDFSIYQDKNVVVKGCGEKYVPINGYVLATEKLMNYANKIMFGEPCSTVPIYRNKK